MQGFLTKFKTETIFRAILLIIAGGLLFAFPDAAQQTIANVIAIILVILGILRIINYFRMSRGETTVNGLKEYGSSSDLVIGILLIVLAGVCASILVKFIPVVLGLIVLVSGLLKLEQATTVRRNGGNATVVFVMALISIVLGIFTVFHPRAVNNIIIQIIGAGLIISGIGDLISLIFSSKYSSNSNVG